MIHKNLFARRFTEFALAAFFTLTLSAQASTEFIPDEPISDFIPLKSDEPTADFCATWNPEFAYRGYQCCSKKLYTYVSTGRKSRRQNSCAPNRIKWTFCDERTPDQVEYIEQVEKGKVKDVLGDILASAAGKGQQAFCHSDEGFLAAGRPLVPTEANRVSLRNAARCTNFGTDQMIGALEWMGREIKHEYREKEFQHAKLVVADIAAPRGGCISGRGGRRAHKSHGNGIDADLGYFNPVNSKPGEERFNKLFYVATNWWFLKKLFKNPYACVKSVFVDQSHIRKLERYAHTDPEWAKLRPYIRHVRGHKDHFHIRVGDVPGVPGCNHAPDPNDDEEVADEADGTEVASTDDENQDAEASADEVNAERKASPEGQQRAVAATDTIVVSGNIIPDHKLEPAITQKYEVKRSKKHRSSRRVASSHKRSKTSSD